MILASFAEVFSIGAIFPFLGVLIDPDRIFNRPLVHDVAFAFGILEPHQLLFPLTIIFCAASLLAGFLRLLLLYSSTNFSFAAGADISIDMYRRTLFQPYSVHANRNTSEVINGIHVKSNIIIYNIVMPILTLTSSILMLVSIVAALMAVDSIVFLSAFTTFGIIYGLIIFKTRKKLFSNSQVISHETDQTLKALQEGLGGIRDVLIGGSQEAYCKVFKDSDLPLRRAQSNNIIISTSPRYVMESMGMALIAVLAYLMSHQAEGVAKAIPTLGALAIGAQRLLPILQQGYAAVVHMRGSQASLQDILELLDQPLPANADQPPPPPIAFQRAIVFDNVSFRYSESAKWVLSNVNLTIEKGSRVGFLGVTGSGKSTLLDIVMGLLDPTEGRFLVDNQEITAGNLRSWQVRIAHVPQSIFLSDSSIGENIAFGLQKDQIDHDLVCQAAKRAQIADFIESMPDGYNSFVGERGIRLSGGQRQRIGIARALYKQADVIIFDEATSALDNETENAVMEAIEGLAHDLTIIIIAHRLTTLRKCDAIYELSNGSISRLSGYDSLMKKSVNTP